MEYTAWYKCRACGKIFEDTGHLFNFQKGTMHGKVVIEAKDVIVHQCDNAGRKGFADLFCGPKRKEI